MGRIAPTHIYKLFVIYQNDPQSMRVFSNTMDDLLASWKRTVVPAPIGLPPPSLINSFPNSTSAYAICVNTLEDSVTEDANATLAAESSQKTDAFLAAVSK